MGIGTPACRTPTTRPGRWAWATRSRSRGAPPASFRSRVDGVLTGPSHRHPWEYKDGPYQQIGGYAIEFAVPGRFVFTTVRGGRHEVPETAPDRAFEMLKRFLNGEKF